MFVIVIIIFFYLSRDGAICLGFYFYICLEGSGWVYFFGNGGNWFEGLGVFDS